jgi:N-acetylmuramate 1-kinase
MEAQKVATLSAGDITDTEHRVDRFLHERGLDGARVVPLTGDASDRKYFRVIAGDGSSMVLALYAGPIELASLPFANVAELFGRVPLPVPALLAHSDALGIVALQDLGDVTLQAHVGAAATTEHAALYRQAVALVELLQRRGVDLVSDRSLPYSVAFDVERLTWELEFFVRHFVEGYRAIVLSPAERAALADEWIAIAAELSAEPRVLCHRDYHSRNLMLHEGRLYMIDFQDARLGPETYDLVSLLRDSYVDITEQDVDDLLAYFLALKGTPELPGYRARFDLMALQRNLKALGTFGYQTTIRRNPVYIQYIPRTLRYARTNLEKHPRFGRLRELLAGHIEELR